MIAYAQALILDRASLTDAQQNNDVTLAQELLQDAYRTDVRTLVAESRRRMNSAINPIEAYRSLKVREGLIKERGASTTATGL